LVTTARPHDSQSNLQSCPTSTPITASFAPAHQLAQNQSPHGLTVTSDSAPTCSAVTRRLRDERRHEAQAAPSNASFTTLLTTDSSSTIANTHIATPPHSATTSARALRADERLGRRRRRRQAHRRQ
jgi:hypothetical protein